MIEQALRSELKPLVGRRRRLVLSRRLTLCWLIAALLGLLLVTLQWVLDWNLFWAAMLLVGLTAGISLRIAWSVFQWGPDYHAVAQAIERDHPEAKALILAAVEQQPATPISELGYLQRAVIKEALVHATLHDWGRSVPRRSLWTTFTAQMAVLVLLAALVSQLVPAWGWLHLPASPQWAPTRTSVTISPGDTSLEAGAPVVITARFSGRIPSEAVLVYGPAAGGVTQRQILNKNLDDPLFGGMIGHVQENLLYHVEYAGQQSPDYHLTVFDYPELLQADAHIVYPAYTHLPEKTILNTRRIGVVEGSHVALSFTLNKPVSEARLVPREGDPIDLVADANTAGLYHTALVATQDERFELQLRDADGRNNKLPPRLVMEVNKNRPPVLKATFPAQDTEASPLEELSLEAQVTDDYGLTGYGLTYMLAGQSSHQIQLGSAETPPDEQTMQTMLTMEDLHAQPDQLLSYYFWADDVGPDGQSRRTTSDMFFTEVRHFDEIFRESESFQDQQQQQRQQDQQDQSGQQAGQLTQLQKQIITATWNLKQRADRHADANALHTDLTLVRDSQAEAREQAQSALAQARDAEAGQALRAAGDFMEQALDGLNQALASGAGDDLMPAVASEQAAYQELLKLREQEFNVTQARNGSRSSNRNSQQFQQQLRQLNLTQREDRYETQRLAQAQNQSQQQENLQVMNRLQDLARRQQEMSQRLREAQAALQQARDEEQRREAQRELKRLRDEQLQALEDADQLQQRMERPQNRQRMADARQQMEQTRQRMQQSTEQLQEGQVGQAVANTTRAQRELENMREDLRRSTASQFSQQMRDMRRLAQDMSREQQDIAEQLRQQMEPSQRSLTDDGVHQDLAQRLAQQQQRVEDLIDQMQEVSEDSETAEPLLSRKLYDTLRQASTSDVNESLSTARQLVQRNFLTQAQTAEQQAREDIERMRTGVEDAARGILGDEADSLRLARSELDDLIRQVRQEAESRRNSSAEDPGRRAENRGAAADPNAEPEGQRNGGGVDNQRQRLAQNDEGQRGGQAGDRMTQGREGRGQRTGDRLATAEPNAEPGGAGGQRGGRTGDRNAGSQNNRGGGGGWNPLDEWAGDDFRGPLTGGDYRQWSDRLRDVEEMLAQDELRNEAARVRDRARTIRAEFTRHGTEPQWDLVLDNIMGPLVELRKEVADQLAHMQSDESLVPIDRDPVPDRYAERVRRYFENLGDQQP